jgi:succinate dehydrogenase / fumarate reductase membrane anchor subunit
MREERWWTWHILASVVILVFLGLHMVIMHLEAIVGIFNPEPGHPIEWANVLSRMKSAGFMVSYIVLLGAALFHGLYGLRNILFELNPGAGTKKALTFLFVVGGLALFAFGAWAAWQSFALAQAIPTTARSL